MFYCDTDSKLHFVEVNLCKIVHSKSIETDTVMAQGRALFIGNKTQGISIIKL